MGNISFDYSKGRALEKVADAATNVGLLILKAAEADATLKRRTDLAAILGAAGNTEADFTNYARKTGLTGVVTVDTTTDTAYLNISNQTWTSSGGATNNTTVALIIYYQEAAADATRIPLTKHDWAVTTDGSDLTEQNPATGFINVA